MLRAIPLTLTLIWLCIDSPRMFAAESQFALQVLAVTLFTRTIPLRTALTAFSMGVGIVAPLVTLTGTALASIGVDVDNHAGNWLVVPLIEETLKLLPVAWLAGRHVRTTGLPFNGSDWLAVAAMSGAGFAMVENAYLSHHDLVYRYGPALGPFYMFPTAWGYAAISVTAQAPLSPALERGCRSRRHELGRGGAGCEYRLARCSPGSHWNTASPTCSTTSGGKWRLPLARGVLRLRCFWRRSFSSSRPTWSRHAPRCATRQSFDGS